MIHIINTLLFIFLNYIYIKIWKKKFKKTPTGAGIILIIPLAYFIIALNQNYLYFLILVLFSIIYFFDDLIMINFIWRIILQILTPILIYLSIYQLDIYLIIFNVLIFFILVNTLNFQDGEDLNLTSLLLMIFLVLYFYSDNLIIKNTSILIINYLIIFGFFNAKKNNLYLGDTGCFIISIIILLLALLDKKNFLLHNMLLSIIIFPLIDAFLVVLYRIFKKENLITRNYYHIYQLYSKKMKYKLYLCPNILMALINSYIFLNYMVSLKLYYILIFVNVFACAILRLISYKFGFQNEN
tara:strand:- start:4430 stop:5323 length:894 start_codon:yes stop_codon:yes gene_type:complete